VAARVQSKKKKSLAVSLKGLAAKMTCFLHACVGNPAREENKSDNAVPDFREVKDKLRISNLCLALINNIRSCYYYAFKNYTTLSVNLKMVM
jgi:hypothetical protein